MSDNPFTPQATAAFNARLDEIVGGIQNAVLSIRQEFNGRGLLYCSETVQTIYRRIDEAIPEMGKAAAESARFAFEAGDCGFSKSLESQLLDVFESNFASGFQRLCAVRVSATQAIRDALSNKQMLENSEYLQIAKRAQINGQLELRRYFQTLNRGRKRWYEFIPAANLLISLFKLH